MNSRRFLAVSNAGPLIHPAKAGLLDLLRQLFAETVVPSQVKVEVVDRGKGGGFADALQVETALKQGWMREEEVKTPTSFLDTVGTAGLARAEAAVIYHAYRNQATALLDDEGARVFARNLGVQVRGSLGIVIEALKKGLIGEPEALAGLERLSEIMYLDLDTYRLARGEMGRMGAAPK